MPREYKGRQEVRHTKWRRRVKGEENGTCKVCDNEISPDEHGVKHFDLCHSCQGDASEALWRNGGRKISNEHLDPATIQLRIEIQGYRRNYLGK